MVSRFYPFTPVINRPKTATFQGILVFGRLYTCPFHGGNTGSIPVGRANDFNGLAERVGCVSNGWPIYGSGQQWSFAVTTGDLVRHMRNNELKSPNDWRHQTLNGNEAATTDNQWR